VRHVLEPRLEQQLVEARRVVSDTRALLARFDATPEDQATLVSSIDQLDEFFLLVVVGEFNAGKSAFINALIGEAALEEGVTPTTAQIHLLAYADRLTREMRGSVQVIGAPAPLLKEVHIVDTPGTNAIIREHERLTTDFVPRSDIVLFVTSADRPFTETERAFLQAIRDWGKKIVVVVNKVDIFDSEADRDRVLVYVHDAMRRLVGVDSDVFGVSARLAQRAKHGEPSLWAASGFEALEHFIAQTLDDVGRFRLKLANPVGVARALAQRYAAIAEERLTLLNDDLSLLGDVDRQLQLYREDMKRGFEARLGAVERVVLDMERRGDRFFDETLRIGRVVDLLNRARVQKEFEQQVVAEAPREIEQKVTELIEWLIDQDFHQWQAVTERLADRQRRHASRVLGAPDVGSFHGDRARLIGSVGREAQRVVDTYDKQREGAALADQARIAVATAAAAGGAAVGLGTLVTIAASTVAADVTGILLASVIAGIGFLVIPARRRRAKAHLQEQVAALRARLTESLAAQFEQAQARSAERLADAVAPYARFVRAEEARWTDARAALTAVDARASALLRAGDLADRLI
jgi:small GTP-binding protein